METTKLTSTGMQLMGLEVQSFEARNLLYAANSIAEVIGHQFTVNELDALLGIYLGHDYCVGILNKEFFILDVHTLNTEEEDIEKCDSFCSIIETALDWVYDLQELLEDNVDISEDEKFEEAAELDRLEKVFDGMKAAIKNTSSL